MFKFSAALIFASSVSAQWQGQLDSSHYWDCNGQSCDAGTLQPWNDSEYSASPLYAPTDPAKHGGAQYGEKMWMTGAANDQLAQMMGSDDGCCGHTDEGGCGKCLLVQNPSAVNSDWSAVIMKKSRCPPNSNGCEWGKTHFDLAVPGFDNLQYSTANCCGNGSKAKTYMSRDQSAACGTWYNSGSSTITGCDCSSLPGGDLQDGCELFASWGWTSGDPQLNYKVVDCPAGFVALVQSAFSPSGPSDGDVDPTPGPDPTPTPGNYVYGDSCGTPYDDDCNGCDCHFSWPAGSDWNDPEAHCRCK